jgi:L-asparaginase
MTHPLVFLSAGGTIEKTYIAESGTLGFTTSALSRWLTDCRIAQSWRAETLMLIDSLDMNARHRDQIARHIAGLCESKIVLVHGTDTMVDTAHAVMLQRRDHQTVVLTGAMVPASMEHTDAFFNLGLATAAVTLCPPGVYIAMSGQLFPADQVIKNKEKGVFERHLPA